MATTAKKKPAAPKPRARREATRAAAETPSGMPVLKIARALRRWADTVLGIAGSAADLSMVVAKGTARSPGQKVAIEKAGSLLRRARETAGMTTQELGSAIDLSDASLLGLAENGKAALPFEVILRLAGVLGRHDPATFMMKLTRSYNPDLWKALDDLGIGKLVVQAGRERELANLYRACDAARRLSDEDFAAVLDFVKTGFEMAVDFRSRPTEPSVP